MNDGDFLLLAQLLVHHVHFGRTNHRLSERDDGLRRADLDFSKPLKKKEEWRLFSVFVISPSDSLQIENRHRPWLSPKGNGATGFGCLQVKHIRTESLGPLSDDDFMFYSIQFY